MNKYFIAYEKNLPHRTPIKVNAIVETEHNLNTETGFLAFIKKMQWNQDEIFIINWKIMDTRYDIMSSNFRDNSIPIEDAIKRLQITKPAK